MNNLLSLSFLGLKAPAMGCKILLNNRKMWVYAVLPTLLGSIWSMLAILESSIPQGEAWWSKAMLALLVWALGAGILFMQILIALAAPVLDLLSEQTEEELGTLPRGASFIKEITSWTFWRRALGSIKEALKLLIFKMAMVLIATMLSFIPVLGIYLSYPVSGIATAIDFLDYPLARRNWKLKQKIDMLKRNWPACLVYSLIVFILFEEIPGAAGIFLAPIVIGGTWLMSNLNIEPVNLPD